MTIYDYFERACRRSLDPVDGDPVSDGDGNSAVFAIKMTDRRITAASYRCTTCITLVAVCEHLSELVIGFEPQSVLEMNPQSLLVLHPDIPEAKRSVAALALKALQSALGGASH